MLYKQKDVYWYWSSWCHQVFLHFLCWEQNTDSFDMIENLVFPVLTALRLGLGNEMHCIVEKVISPGTLMEIVFRHLRLGNCKRYDLILHCHETWLPMRMESVHNSAQCSHSFSKKLQWMEIIISVLPRFCTEHAATLIMLQGTG